MISTPEAEADRAAFLAKWKNSSTPEEIERERNQAEARALRHKEAKRAEAQKRRERAEELRPELDALIERFARFREQRKGFALAPGTDAAIAELVADTHEGERKWSNRQIATILGITDQTVRASIAKHEAKAANERKAAA